MRSPSIPPLPSGRAMRSNACWRWGETRGAAAVRLIIEPIVRAALLEDLGGAGDIKTEAIVPEEAEVEAVIAARQPGVVAGLDAALLAFELLDPALRIERLRDDGARISRGEIVARIKGRARGVLAAERTALNFLSRMSGVA